MRLGAVDVDAEHHGQRGLTVVLCVRVEQAGDAQRVEHDALVACVLFQEAPVERGVVRDEDVGSEQWMAHAFNVLVERGRVLDHLVRDPVNRLSRIPDRDAGVDEAGALVNDLEVAGDFAPRDFADLVVGTDPGSFRIANEVSHNNPF